MRKCAGEVEIWRHFAVLEKKSREINNSLDAILTCDSEQYPVIHLALHILTTLAVSIATAERTFSTLRLLKTWTRSRMSQDRLTGLDLIICQS